MIWADWRRRLPAEASVPKVVAEGHVSWSSLLDRPIVCWMVASTTDDGAGAVAVAKAGRLLFDGSPAATHSPIKSRLQPGYKLYHRASWLTSCDRLCTAFRCKSEPQSMKDTLCMTACFNCCLKRSFTAESFQQKILKIHSNFRVPPAAKEPCRYHLLGRKHLRQLELSKSQTPFTRGCSLRFRYWYICWCWYWLSHQPILPSSQILHVITWRCSKDDATVL